MASPQTTVVIAVAKLPKQTQIKLAKASQLANAGKFDAAEKLIRALLRKGRVPAEAWFLLGALRGHVGDLAESEQFLRRALSLARNNADGWYNLGNTLQAQGKFTEAANAFETALRLKPDKLEAWFMLGNTRDDLNQPDQALHCYHKALELNPGFAPAWSNLGKLQAAQGQTEAAIEHYRKAVSLSPGLHEARQQLAGQLSNTGKLDEALQVLDQAAAYGAAGRDPSVSAQPILAAARAKVLDQKGEFTLAHQAIEPFLDQSPPQIDVALVHARFCHHTQDCDHAIANLNTLIDSAERSNLLSLDHQRQAHFTLADLYDRQKRFDAAFKHYKTGNELQRAKSRFDPDAHHRDVQAIIAALSRTQQQNLPVSSCTDARPVFIVGMPRSATSLVEQIIASHPQAAGAGELTTIGHIVQDNSTERNDYPGLLDSLTTSQLDAMSERYLAELERHGSEDDLRITDKMPVNFLFLPLIARIFPQGRVIHTRRNALDTCLSCYFRNFSLSYAWTNDLQDLSAYFKDYQTLMNQWHQAPLLPTMELDYQDLVAEPEQETHRILDFLDLPWDDNCLQFHQSKRVVSTASYDQVRQPIYTRSLARWKNYEAHLKPLIEGLGVRDVENNRLQIRHESLSQPIKFVK